MTIKKLPQKITYRPGPLTELILKRLTETGQGFREYVDDLIATDCGVPTPERKQGFAADTDRAAKAQKKSVQKRMKQK